MVKTQDLLIDEGHHNVTRALGHVQPFVLVGHAARVDQNMADRVVDGAVLANKVGTTSLVVDSTLVEGDVDAK